MNRAWQAVAIGLLAIGLAGCGQQGSKGGNAGGTKVELWHYFSEEQAKPLKDLIARFEKDNPGISVRPVYQGNPRELKQKLDGGFAVDPPNSPAVSMVYESWTDDFHSRGYMDPVQNHLDGEEGLTKEEQEDFVKVFREGNTWDGKLVTLPFNKSIYLLYANTDMVKDAGMATVPQTQAQWAEAVRKMTWRDGGRTTAYGMGVQPRSESFTTLLFARGGTILDTEGKPKLNSPEALEVVKMLKDLQYPEKHLYVNPDYMSVPFGNKQIAMYCYSSASLPYNVKLSSGKFAYEAAPVPGVEGVEPRYLMQGTNIGIFGGHPEATRKASWKLIKFLTSPQNSAAFATRAGYMPIRYSSLEIPEFKDYIAAHPDYALAANLVLTDKGHQEPKSRGWEGVRLDVDSMVDSLLSRPDSDPQALLNDLQKKAETKMLPPAK